MREEKKTEEVAVLARKTTNQPDVIPIHRAAWNRERWILQSDGGDWDSVTGLLLSNQATKHPDAMEWKECSYAHQLRNNRTPHQMPTVMLCCALFRYWIRANIGIETTMPCVGTVVDAVVVVSLFVCAILLVRIYAPRFAYHSSSLYWAFEESIYGMWCMCSGDANRLIFWHTSMWNVR